jgi:hypothetical protein
MFLPNNGGVEILIRIFMNGWHWLPKTHPKIGGIRWVTLEVLLTDEVLSWLINVGMEIREFLGEVAVLMLDVGDLLGSYWCLWGGVLAPFEQLSDFEALLEGLDEVLTFDWISEAVGCEGDRHLRKTSGELIKLLWMWPLFDNVSFQYIVDDTWFIGSNVVLIEP